MLCDYHVYLISYEEGEKRMKIVTEGAMEYMLFFKDSKGKHWCIDAKLCHAVAIDTWKQQLDTKLIIQRRNITLSLFVFSFLKATHQQFCSWD